jgi:hypothetical protein
MGNTMETETRRSDRWPAEAVESSSLNWWPVLAVVLVLAGYGVAALVAAIVNGDVEFGDRAGVALVGAAPSLGALGIALGIVGARRVGLRWLAWIAVLLGVVLVLGSILVIGAVVLAFRTFS